MVSASLEINIDQCRDISVEVSVDHCNDNSLKVNFDQGRDIILEVIVDQFRDTIFEVNVDQCSVTALTVNVYQYRNISNLRSRLIIVEILGWRSMLITMNMPQTCGCSKTRCPCETQVIYPMMCDMHRHFMRLKAK